MKGFIKDKTIILTEPLPEDLQDGDIVEISIVRVEAKTYPFPVFNLGVKEEYLNRKIENGVFAMNSPLQQAIDLAQSLSPTEQVELFKVLSALVDRTNPLETQNRHFWTSHSLEELIQEQQPPIVTDIDSLGGDFWDDEESPDEFLEFLRQQRRAEQIEDL